MTPKPSLNARSCVERSCLFVRSKSNFLGRLFRGCRAVSDYDGDSSEVERLTATVSFNEIVDLKAELINTYGIGDSG